ncbi:Nucleoside-diphosphate-sugar epimerase [Saccharopolyspora flava]|uniref:Nucleoside-diphosphate-sugar epimerase n=1 Tax=Saccharopolyspora flava TaxID=95161 RepID=A0A1I6U857_9PSEU|nr:NAD(P)-dependent oxidoreductase [Saccharopolyspora flava]SFS97729.1 Nucleoside-diphosphate-sugar epimerase [Saccharopolyspora flava]
MPERILITGAAGGIGTLMRPRLRRAGRTLRLLDVVPPEPAAPDEDVEVVEGSVTDPDAMLRACRDVDAVLHLGGHSRETGWAETLSVNIDGTRTVLEAARLAGVPRVILASSNHVVGFRPAAEAPAADSSPRPDTYYGVSKAAMEALGSLYHSRFGMDVLCVRIGSCFEKVHDERGLGLWLSPDDAARLFEACLNHPSPGYRVLWGVSDNTRRPVPLTEAAELGYVSRDDSEIFAAEVTPDSDHPLLGGPFTTTPLGEPN